MINLNFELQDAIQEGNSTQVGSLIEQGAMVNLGHPWELSPLYEAARRGHENIVKLLLDQGAEIDYQVQDPDHDQDPNENGDAPLHGAVAAGKEEIVGLLLSRGANPNINGRYGYTPLYGAASQGYETIASLLLNNGASLDHKGQNGETPLHVAAHAGKEEIVRLFLNEKANLDIRDNDGHTPICVAVRQGYQNVVSLLLDAGVSVDYQDQEGNTLLHIAVLAAKEAVAALLLNRGAKLDIKNNRKYTPLYLAIKSFRSRDIAQLLLQYGAYSYPCEQYLDFSKYWNSLDIYSARDLSFYVTLVLAGVKVPKHQLLPEHLALRKQRIENTIRDWLKPLLLSETTCRRITSRVLRVLPLLIRWLDVVAQLDVIVQEEKEAISNQSEALPKNYALLFFRGVLDDECNNVVFQSTKKDESNDTLSSRIKALPQELQDSVQGYFIHKEFSPLIEFLQQAYTLPQKVAQYLVESSFANPNSRRTFYQNLFRQDSQTPCPPPVFNQTTHSVHKQLPLR